MALTESLVDNFNSGSLATNWSNSYGGTAIVSGRVSMPTGTAYPGLGSSVTYTFTGSSVYAQCTPPAGTTGAEQYYFGVQDATQSEVNKFRAYVYGVGHISLEAHVNGVDYGVELGIYPADAPWWRLRDDGAQKIYFDTSTDGKTWVNRWSQAYTGTWPQMYIYSFSGNYQSDTPNNPGFVDNVNTDGTTVVTDPKQGGSDFYMSLPMGPFADSIGMQSGEFITNGHSWVPILDEDFSSKPNSTAVRTDYPNMGYYNGFGDTSGQGLYDPDSVLTVVNGVLTANLHTGTPSAAAGGGAAKPLIACVMPDNYQDTVYGRATVRFRANQVNPGSGNQVGYKIVWFYFPNDNNWNEGELDAFESDVGPGARSRPANAIPGSGKNASGQPTSGSDVYSMTFAPGYDLFMPTDMSTWHVATVEWAPEAIYIYWDNVLIGLLDNSKGAWVPRNPMNFKLQMETVINEGTVDPTATAKIEIDRVQTWMLGGYGAGGYGYNGYGV